MSFFGLDERVDLNEKLLLPDVWVETRVGEDDGELDHEALQEGGQQEE